MSVLRPIHHCALSDVGVKRSHNQDAFGVVVASSDDVWRQKGHLFVVADGMGAHAVGELASKLAVDTIRLTYGKLRDQPPSSSLQQSIVEANQTIHERGRQNREFEGMGTTATALVLATDGAWVGHVGDSRCYRIRGDRIEQLSFDHSLVWELARKHKVDPERITSVRSNIIVRSLGPEPEVRVDLNGPYDVREGDRFLLCSDGLSGPVSDKELWAVASLLPCDEACRFFVDLANLRGGIDNVTALLIQVGEAPASKEASTPVLRAAAQGIWRLASKVPLSWWFLLTGLATSGAGFLMRDKGVPWLLFVAIMGVLLLCAALGAFILSRRQARKVDVARDDAPPPIFRSLQCQVERPMVDRFAQAAQSFHELAVEEKWKVDWAELGKRQAAAAGALAKDQAADAFVEYCRAISLLAEGLRAAKEKIEVFKPQFERKRPSSN